MQVITITPSGEKVAYGYDPQHRDALIVFYRDCVTQGRIVSFTIEEGGR